MIAFVYGTTGELIKLAPIISRLEARGNRLEMWCTGQQADELTAMADEMGLPRPTLLLGKGFRGNPLTKAQHIPTWAGQVGLNFAYSARRLKRLMHDGPGCVVVHGDTMTTVVGALMGRALDVPVAHVEAGMRSHDWRHPFPEELNRRIATKLVRLHFAPGPIPVTNLRRAKGDVVDTYFNTVRDSLDLVPEEKAELEAHFGPLPDRYGIVSLHRFELLQESTIFDDTLRALRDAARETPLFFIDHSVTAAKISALGLDSLFDGTSFIRTPKLSYFAFISLVRRSAFAVTDSGGLQQESFYLGHPCLVHRMTTETLEGLSQNVVLSRYDMKALRDFLADPDRYALDGPPAGPSPSDIVVDELVARGFCI